MSLVKKCTNYIKIRRLGEGTSSEVYLVKDVKTEMLYVAKEMYIKNFEEKMLMQLFSETKILEALTHPNIIKLYEFYKTKSEKLVLILEYAEGDDLYKKILERKKKYFLEKDIKKWIIQLTKALKHSHDHKILHRDLKTSNIFLNKENDIKLGDFGLAKNLGKIEFSIGGMLGTPVYLAPEVIQTSVISYKSDVWSLGIVFYEMLSLNFPFYATDLSSLIKKICNDDLDDLPHVFSKELKDFIFWILDKDVDKRPDVYQVFNSAFFRKIHIEVFGDEVFKQIEIRSDFRISENGLKKDFKKLKTYRHSEYKKTIDLLKQNNNQVVKNSKFKNNDQAFFELEESDVFINSSFVDQIKKDKDKICEEFNFENKEDINIRHSDIINKDEILESKIQNKEDSDLILSSLKDFENSEIIETGNHNLKSEYGSFSNSSLLLLSANSS